MGLVCTVGVGAMYLAPSLAGPPEQIAVPAPTEEPTMEPTLLETPFEEPTPLETLPAEPLPTETTAPTTSVPTTTFPTASNPPPYVPPKTTKPKKTKTPKPPKIELGSVTVTISKVTTEKFTAKWAKVENAKKYDVNGCGVNNKSISDKGLEFKFPSGTKCSFKINASGSGNYKDGPESTTKVKPVYGQPINLQLIPNADHPTESFNATWTDPVHAVVGATKYKIETECVHGENVVSGIQIFFDDSPPVCYVKVQAIGDDNFSEGPFTEQKQINRNA